MCDPVTVTVLLTNRQGAVVVEVINLKLLQRVGITLFLLPALMPSAAAFGQGRSEEARNPRAENRQDGQNRRDPVAVPEPGSLALMVVGAGIVGLGLYRRRNRRR